MLPSDDEPRTIDPGATCERRRSTSDSPITVDTRKVQHQTPPEPTIPTDPTNAATSPPLAEPQNLTGQISRTGDRTLVCDAYYDVWQGTWPSKGNITVAMKILRAKGVQADVQPKLVRRLHREMKVWASLTHRNVVALLGYTEEPAGPALISMFYQNGSVVDYLQLNPNSDRYRICADISAGLLYLHSHQPPIVHGDIKGANVLIDADGNAALCDFGLSLLLDNQPTGYTFSEFGGTLRFLAPELMDDETSKTTATDMYAMGCTCMQVLLSQEPYHGLRDKNVYGAIHGGQPPFQLEEEQIATLRLDFIILKRTWDPAATQRPSAFELNTAVQVCLSHENKVEPVVTDPTNHEQPLFVPKRPIFTGGGRNNITSVRDLATQHHWRMNFEREERGQDRLGRWIHMCRLHLDGVAVAAGCGYNVMSARADACEMWLSRNGYYP